MESAYSDVLKSIKGRPCPRRSIIAPYRLETRNWDLLAALSESWQPNALVVLRDLLRNIIGRRHIFFAPSCRSAIAQILSLLPQHEVVMPAYTCPVVKTAVEIAGKDIIYADVTRNNINSTATEFAKHAKKGRILLPTHIFGIPTDIENICDLAREQGCLTIEDSAAAFGARRNGRLLGTFGDFSVFSFERSKRLPAFRGAFIVMNNEQILDPAMLDTHRMVQTDNALPFQEIVFSMLHNVATIPWLYGRFTITQLLRRYARTSCEPISNQREEAQKSPFYTHDFHPYQAALVVRMLKRLDCIQKHIAELVLAYINAFKGTSIQTFLTDQSDYAGLLRFPISFPGVERTDMLRRALNRGLYLETNYEHPLPPESDYKNYPNAVWAAQNIVLLPLYTRLFRKDAERLARQVVDVYEGKFSHNSKSLV